MNEVDKYNNLVDYVYSNFKFKYYPSEIFISECLDIIGSADPDHLDCVVYDLSMFSSLLTKDHVFNQSFLEVLFMYLTHKEDDTDEMDYILEELDSAVFEAIVDKSGISNFKEIIERNRINYILESINSMIQREGLHALVVGWLNTKSVFTIKNYSIGVVYV